MRSKAIIYRTAIVNKFYAVTYASDLLFLNRSTAISEAKKLISKKEEEIKTHRWIDVCMNVDGRDTWRTFEKIINDGNERYIGIITEILVVE